ncbi:hypothetical protein CHU98_g4023 [Xylaria longipes]|nr:hypothetical protein CHU98_g4023 [Xylaria longipes]
MTISQDGLPAWLVAFAGGSGAAAFFRGEVLDTSWRVQKASIGCSVPSTIDIGNVEAVDYGCIETPTRVADRYYDIDTRYRRIQRTIDDKD